MTYRDRLRREGWSIAGRRLQRQLGYAGGLEAEVLLAHLLSTKSPQIFAESAVMGDGSDWTAEELSLLGDIGIAADVTVYDDGRHHSPHVHERPFPGTLLFVPGALLRNDRGGTPADWDEMIHGGKVDQAACNRLYERRLLPLLCYADNQAEALGTRAFITMPGIGCGQFAGPFRGKMGEHLKRALIDLVERHAARLPNIAALYFDPYGECRNERHKFGDLALMVRPFTMGNDNKPQLCPPSHYAEDGDDFGACRLFSFVAWDHVSWPGNDYFGGARATDDGVKAAATSSMEAITGIAGSYNRNSFGYRPPAGFQTWEAVVIEQGIQLRGNAPFIAAPG